MGLKQVKSDAFDQLLLLLHVKRCTSAILVANQQKVLKQYKSDVLDQLLGLVHIKRCTCATLMSKHPNGLKKS